MESIDNPRDIRLQPVAERDLPLLLKIYSSTREEEMKLTGWTDEEKAEFLQMQFNLQHQYYQMNYSKASYDKVIYQGKEAGRFYVDRRGDEIRIVDIALLPEFRRKGIGRRLMRSIMEEGLKKGIPVSLHVERFNPALEFYERLGFRIIDETDVHCLMQWTPDSRASFEKERQMG
jgi:ribosomal protein S18 acetylase RimI-like enzyme